MPAGILLTLSGTRPATRLEAKRKIGEGYNAVVVDESLARKDTAESCFPPFVRGSRTFKEWLIVLSL